MLGVGGLIDNLTGANKNGRLKGTVVLMRKNVLDLNDFGAAILDGLTEFLGKGITCQLVSSTAVDNSKRFCFVCFLRSSPLGRSSSCSISQKLASDPGSSLPEHGKKS
jgi:hypothetical protein